MSIELSRFGRMTSIVGAGVSATGLRLDVFTATEAGFAVNAVLISGAQDAMLIDTGYTRADSLRIAAAVLDSQKNLKTIYVSQADPDYFFGTGTMHRLFPDARIIATEPTVREIKRTLVEKITYWGPILGGNAPQPPEVPAVMENRSLHLEGHTFEVHGLDDAVPEHSFVWIPSLRAVVGGICVFAGLHVWTANSTTPAARTAWLEKLDAMSRLEPVIVVPGHMRIGSALDATQIDYTREYLERFETELASARDSAELIANMLRAFPDEGLLTALEIGAKVNKGEMTW